MSTFNMWVRNCEEEVTTAIPGKITGEVPKWLTGAFYRNGPGRFKFGPDEYQHMFDGAALIHCIKFNNGNVTYKSRFLESEAYKDNIKANHIVMTGFGTKSLFDPCKGFFNKVNSLLKPEDSSPDNSVVSIYPFSEDLFAFGESPVVHKINKDTLEVNGTINMFKINGVVNHCAHPHIEYDGTVYNLGMKIEGSSAVHKITCFPKSENSGSESMFKNARIVATLKPRWKYNPSYMHTFGITPNYFILVQHPLTISTLTIAKCKLKNEPILNAFNWHEKENTVISILSRSSGECIQWYTTKAFFFMHIINQYERDDEIVLDLCAYDNASILHNMYVNNLKNMDVNEITAKMFKSQPIRLVLPMEKPKGTMVEPQVLCNSLCEMPAINYKHYLGKMYRYFYAINADITDENPGKVIKVDILEKTVTAWSAPNCYIGEPIFVPSPNPKGEDDGVLLCSMLFGDGDENYTGVIVLDAQTLTEICRADFQTPAPAPKCLHGWFMHSGESN